MGGGSWNASTFSNYVSTTKNVTLDSCGSYDTSSLSFNQMYKARTLDNLLNPYNVIRECCDSEEHPNTIPVILALDVTGSMGKAAVEVASKLNVIMTKLYEEIKDVQFMVMGIGDLAYDDYPIQASQFESDIRIAEQLDKVFFEFGGGGNSYESYTAAWYFGRYCTKLDCWKRNKKGIIITMGDESLNPYLPKNSLEDKLGINLQADVPTDVLYNEVKEYYNIYHINVNHGGWNHSMREWKNYLGDNFKEANLNNIADVICNIIIDEVKSESNTSNAEGYISW